MLGCSVSDGKKAREANIAKDKVSRLCLRNGALRTGWEDSMQCPEGVSSYSYLK